jgi:hypothetical protein
VLLLIMLGLLVVGVSGIWDHKPYYARILARWREGVLVLDGICDARWGSLHWELLSRLSKLHELHRTTPGF